MKDFEEYISKLRSSGLRPTKQRLMISEMLFRRSETFHFTIEDLNKLLKKKFNVKISVATIYNTVHVFKKKGYLKEIALNGNKTFYDTNVLKHHHFYDEDTEKLTDIDNGMLFVNNIPTVPLNKPVKSVEVMVKVANDKHNRK